MNTGIFRIALAAMLAFVAALGVSLTNGVTSAVALQNALILALVAGAIVALLNWAMAIAQRKGYSPWFGFWIFVFLNLLGLLLLWLMPAKGQARR